MRTLLCGMAFVAAFAASANAETQYDRSLEQAAMKIVAGKMGEIRGGFSYKQTPQFVTLQNRFLPSIEPAQKDATNQQKDASRSSIVSPTSPSIF